MDYSDYKVMQTDFWFQGKKYLLDSLMTRVHPESGDIQLKILNLGAGTGDDLEVLQVYGDVYVIDVDSEVLKLVPDHLCIEKRVADACALPYNDESFDVVVSLDVFEHIANDKKAVQEVYRTLKKGGLLITTVPAFQALFSARDIALKHHRRYSKHMLKQLLSDFAHVNLYYWNSILFLPVALQRFLMRGAKPQIESIRLPKPINQLFFYILSVDTWFIKRGFSLPFGISLVGCCRK